MGIAFGQCVAVGGKVPATMFVAVSTEGNINDDANDI